MLSHSQQRRFSAFEQHGFRKTIAVLMEEVVELYRADTIPWVIGYSGGKDSTATLQLVWLAVARLTPAERRKPIYVISTDTLVENPVVAAWVGKSLDRMTETASSQGLPLTGQVWCSPGR